MQSLARLLPASTLGFASVTVGLLQPGQVLAQHHVVADDSLGQERSEVIQAVAVPGGIGDRIGGGARRGANLFHSFSKFDIPALEQVYFNEPSGVEAIFSRITGSDVSEILGTLGVDGAADLFLLNPNGIVFGPDAHLDIAGSFAASTATSLQFGNDLDFSATVPQAAPLLSLNVQPGLQLGGASSDGLGRITSQANLAAGQDLRFAADHLEISAPLTAGADLTLAARQSLDAYDSALQPLLLRAGQDLTLQGNGSVEISALSHPDSGLYAGGNLRLRSSQSVIGDAHFTSGGDFRVEAVEALTGAASDRAVGLISPNDPVIRTGGDVFFPFYEGSSLHILAGGNVTIRDYVWIQGADPNFGLVEAVQLANGTNIAIDGRTVATLDIRAGTTAFLPEGIVGFGNPAPTVAPSTGANIALGPVFFAEANSNFVNGPAFALAGRVLITNQYQPNPALTGDIVVTQNPNLAGFGLLAGKAIITGNFAGGGDIDLHTKGDILLNGAVDAFPPPLFGTQQLLGDGGDIRFQAGGDITLAPGSLVNSVGALGGNLTLISGGEIQASEGGFFSSSVGNQPGQQGGDVTIVAQGLSLNQATISNSVIPLELLLVEPGQAPLPIAANARANAGNVVIDVGQGDLSLRNISQIRSGVDPGGIGTGGSITLTAGNLLVEGGSQIGTILFRQRLDQTGAVIPGAQGQAGNISATVSGLTLLSGSNPQGFASGLLTLAERGSAGGAGNIILNTDRLQIDNGAGIAASTRSTGDSAGIGISARTVDILSGGKIIANSASPELGAGNAGAVVIAASERIRLQGSDPNATERLNNIRRYRQTNAGRGDTLTDILGVDPIYVAENGIFTYSQSDGSSGGSLLQAPQILLGDSSFIVADTFGSGSGGAVLLQSNQIRLSEGAEVLARTLGSADGGNIVIRPLDAQATSSVFIDGFKPFAGIEELQNDQGVVFRDVNSGFPSGFSTNSENNVPGQLVGNGGTIDIETDVLSLSNGGVISARTRGAGAGGAIALNVQDLNLSSGGQILTPTFSSGKAGGISLNASGNVLITGQDQGWSARLTAIQDAYVNELGLTPAEGFERARFLIDPVSPSSGFQSSIQPEASANTTILDIGGTIEIDVAGNFEMNNFSEISVSTRGRGDAGNLRFNVVGDMSLSGNSTIRALVEEGGVGRGGNIVLNANALSLADASQIGTVVFRDDPDTPLLTGGRGIGGDITLKIADALSISGTSSANGETLSSGLLSSTEAGAQGNAGNIDVEAASISLFDSGFITASTGNASDAGQISIRAAQLELTTGGRILAATEAQGNAQDIRLEISDQLRLDQGANISVSSQLSLDPVTGLPLRRDLTVQDLGNPGQIDITATSILFGNASTINAVTQSNADATINIQITENGTVQFEGFNSEISAEALQVGQAGVVNISSPSFFTVLTDLENNNDIVANAERGAGGRVEIGADGQAIALTFNNSDKSARRTPQSDITAESVFGEGGEVEAETTAPELELPTLTLIDPRELIAPSCRATAERSSFVISGKGGLPPGPDEPIYPAFPARWIELLEDSDSTNASSKMRSPVRPRSSGTNNNHMVDSHVVNHHVMDAQAFQRDAQGQVHLIAVSASHLNAFPASTTLCSALLQAANSTAPGVKSR